MGGGIGIGLGVRRSSPEHSAAEEAYKREQPEPLTFGRDQLLYGDGYMEIVTAAVSAGHPLNDEVMRKVSQFRSRVHRVAYAVEMAQRRSESAEADLDQLGDGIQDLASRNIGRIVALEEFDLLPPAPEDLS